MHSMIRALDSLEQEQFIYQEKPMSFGRQLQGVQFPADRDEAAIMAAMVAVIASAAAASSANSSSTSAMSNPAREACTDFNNLNERAFRPYSSALAPNYQEPKEFLWGQKMIKNSICFLRRVKRDQEPPPSTSSHQQHMVSERRRREKLNDSFHRLSMILPPSSKKDKASVLIDARNYLKTLRAQILVLQEKNRKLEAHLPNKEMADQGYKAGNVQVEVLKLGSEEPRSQLEQIHIKIAVGVECNIVNLILHVLECLRGMRVVSIASVDARAYSPQMQQISAGANLKLQIKRCDWNEALFKEAMNRAVGGVAASVETLLVA
ncbi:putative transcription factor bHLH041 [Zingiber officinale]|uniref:putative transcription factor bHLH041 n=1 Tax=Zingiber officinale TaxID=94328 RepID=UPI001C4C56D9|nr:putative transcription factor bHLH041 [Zingiber officinale]XP_042397025.1 putative transcription factor bHLH041 [Zingiber officinale]